jgi:protein-S-isoprenylcysteine O-methyltransferase Ste14
MTAFLIIPIAFVLLLSLSMAKNQLTSTQKLMLSVLAVLVFSMGLIPQMTKHFSWTTLIFLGIAFIILSWRVINHLRSSVPKSPPSDRKDLPGPPGSKP